MNNILPWLFVMLGGMLNAIQSGCNAQLERSLQNPWLAGIVLSIYPLLFFVFGLLIKRNPLPTWAQFQGMPWWAPLGGLAGVVAILAMMTVAEKVGAGPFNGLLVTAGVVTSMMLDHYGWMGFQVHHFNVGRAVGCGLMVCGISLIAKF